MLTLILASLNLNFGNCTADGADFRYAPSSVVIGNRYSSRPSADDYAANDWWPVVDVAPSCSATEFAVKAGWRKDSIEREREVIDWIPSGETNEWGEAIYIPVTNKVAYTVYEIHRLYNKMMKPIAVPSYSIADLTFWCAQQGKMEAVTAALKEMDMYEVYLTTQTVSADNELFQPTLKAIAQKVGLTDAEVSEALAYSLIGGAE